MPRYERDGSWFTIEVESNELIVCDAEGERRRSFEDGDDAEAAYDDRVFEALQEGFRLAEEAIVDPKIALEATLRQDPEDLDALLVYADLLMSKGDPHGELIALYAQQSEDVEALARSFRKEHADYFFGDFEALIDLGLELEWKLGFVRSAILDVERGSWDDGTYGIGEIASMLRAFLMHPTARFLRELTINNVWQQSEEAGELDEIVAVIAATEGPWNALTSLTLMPNLHREISHLEINNGDLLFESFPSLRSLRISCDRLVLRRLSESHLDQLTLERCLSESVMRTLAAARWSELRDLGLTFFGTEGPEGMRALLAQPDHFPKLETLRLSGRFTDELVDYLIAAPAFIERLRVLDFSWGSMTDASARELVKNARAFSALKRLDLSHNNLSNDINYDLRKLPFEVEFGEQRTGEDGADEYFDEIQE